MAVRHVTDTACSKAAWTTHMTETVTASKVLAGWMFDTADTPVNFHRLLLVHASIFLTF